MKRFVVSLGLAVAAAGCVAGEVVPPGEYQAAGTVSQGTVSQGTVSQGTVSQGTVSQGADNAVWGFPFGASKNGMGVKLTLGAGMLSGTWTRTPACTIGDHRLSRDCDWYGVGFTTCTAGTAIKVGAGGCGLGSSSADSMLRVCSGDLPCSGADAIAANDNTAAGGSCAASVSPSVSLTCPTSGRIFVMVAPKDPGVSSFTYSVATSPSHAFNKMLTGGRLEGTVVTGTSGETFASTREHYTITQVDAKPNDGQTYLYTLSRTSDGQPLCLPAHGSGDTRAIALSGIWMHHGFWFPTSDYFSFACSAGVLYKCYEHGDDQTGYRPWETLNGMSLRDYHQTCSRALRADFCGDGKSYTVNGTTVDLFDDRFISTDGNVRGLEIEAMWVRDSYPSLDDDVWAPRPVACLAKKRWDTLPFDACVGVDDPRTGTDDVRAAYCEEKPPEEWLGDSEILEATKSAYIDAGLWQWERSDTHNHHTTSTSQLSTTNGAVDGYLWSPGRVNGSPKLLGAVYKYLDSDSVRPAHTVPLYSYYNAVTQDYLTTTPEHAPPSGYTLTATLGYVWSPQCVNDSPQLCPTGKRLVLYKSGNDSITTLAEYAPATAVTLGYLPR